MRGRLATGARLVRRRRPRCSAGVTLLEVLVALPIMAMLMSACALLLLTVMRGFEERMHAIRTQLEIRRGTVLAARALAPLRTRDLRTVSDSALEIAAHLAVGILCVPVSHTQVTVSWSSPPPSGEGIRVGDVIEVWPRGPDAGTLAPSVERTVLELRNHTGCDGVPASLPGGGGSQSLLTVDSIPGELIAGTPVLVRRRHRWVHYRSAGSWWIGRRTFDGRLWDGTQPVIGPVNSARDGGMQVVAWRQDAMATAHPDSTMLLDVTIRGAIPVGADVRATHRIPVIGNDYSVVRSAPIKATNASP